MLPTNIPGNSPALSAQAVPTSRMGEADAGASEKGGPSFEKVLGQQKNEHAMKSDADAATERTVLPTEPEPQPADATAVAWPLLPPGTDWLAAAQAPLRGENDPADNMAAVTSTGAGAVGDPILVALPTGIVAVGTASSGIPAPSIQPATPTLPSATIPTSSATISAPSAAIFNPSAIPDHTSGPAARLALVQTNVVTPAVTVTGTPATAVSANAAALPAADASMEVEIASARQPAAASTEIQAPGPEATLPSLGVGLSHGKGLGIAAEHSDLLVTTPLGSRQWESAIGNSLVLMANNQQQRAELILTPPHLGRIEVSLSMSGDQATAIFVSPNPAVREALESAMSRLRETLADAGVTLGQVQVGAESFRQPSGERGNGHNPAHGAALGRLGDIGSMTVVAAVGMTTSGSGRGLVDVFV